jgi:hypothetical protein
MHLAEVRVIGDEETAIVNAVLRILPPVHRSVRPLHDFCCASPARGRRSALESAERSFEISQEQRFSLYVKIENFARPRPLVADFETSIPPRVLAFSGPSLLCAWGSFVATHFKDAHADGPARQDLNPRPQGRRHLRR